MIITLDLEQPILSPRGEPLEGGALTLGALVQFVLRNIPAEKKETPVSLRRRSKLIAQVTGYKLVKWDQNTVSEVVEYCEALFCQGDIQPLLEMYRITDAAAAAATEDVR